MASDFMDFLLFPFERLLKSLATRQFASRGSTSSSSTCPCFPSTITCCKVGSQVLILSFFSTQSKDSNIVPEFTLLSKGTGWNSEPCPTAKTKETRSECWETTPRVCSESSGRWGMQPFSSTSQPLHQKSEEFYTKVTSGAPQVVNISRMAVTWLSLGALVDRKTFMIERSNCVSNFVKKNIHVSLYHVGSDGSWGFLRFADSSSLRGFFPLEYVKQVDFGL